MKQVTIKDLIAYRMKHESLVHKLMTVDMPTVFGHFKLHTVEDKLTGEDHLAFTKGEWNEEDHVLVRVHSSNPLADIFGTTRGDKTGLMQKSVRMVEKSGTGVVVSRDQVSREYSSIEQV